MARSGVERRRDRPEHGLPAASACRHGDHHLCPPGRDHARGQPGQQRPHRGRRRAGDERRLRHPPRRIQPRGRCRPRCSRSGSSPARNGGEPSWGAKPFPKANRSGHFVPLASGFAGDDDALPIRAEARVLGATLKAGDSAEYQLGAERHGYLVPARRQRRGQWRASRCARRCRDQRRGGAEHQSARGRRDRPRRHRLRSA